MYRVTILSVFIFDHSALALFVVGVAFTDHSQHPFALDDLAVFTALSDRGLYFHGQTAFRAI
jgi:hypothetical protein